MNDEQLTQWLSNARDAASTSSQEFSTEKASSYALTSIAYSLLIIAERMINLPREEDTQV